MGSGSCTRPARRKALAAHSSGYVSLRIGTDRLSQSSIKSLSFLLPWDPTKESGYSWSPRMRRRPQRRRMSSMLAWWAHLATVLHRTPATCAPLMFVDANATFRRMPSEPDTLRCQPVCSNARSLLQFAASRGLGLSPQFLPDSEPLFSWTSPQGHRKPLTTSVCPPNGSRRAQFTPTPS